MVKLEMSEVEVAAIRPRSGIGRACLFFVFVGLVCVAIGAGVPSVGGGAVFIVGALMLLVMAFIYLMRVPVARNEMCGDVGGRLKSALSEEYGSVVEAFDEYALCGFLGAVVEDGEGDEVHVLVAPSYSWDGMMGKLVLSYTRGTREVELVFVTQGSSVLSGFADTVWWKL